MQIGLLLCVAFFFFLNLSTSKAVELMSFCGFLKCISRGAQYKGFLCVFITFSCWTETTVTQITLNMWMPGAPYTLLWDTHKHTHTHREFVYGWAKIILSSTKQACVWRVKGNSVHIGHSRIRQVCVLVYLIPKNGRSCRLTMATLRPSRCCCRGRQMWTRGTRQAGPHWPWLPSVATLSVFTPFSARGPLPTLLTASMDALLST